MAKKPDGAAAGTQRVTFTKPAAERIGKVVRQVEAGNRDLGPIEWGPRGVAATPGAPIKLAAFTGTSSWIIGSAKTVTILQQSIDTATNPIGEFFPGSTNTAVAHSCLFSIPGTVSTSSYSTTLVAITRINGAWHVISSIAN
jgi:hypothetical protein